jgi:hypothetical protein
MTHIYTISYECHDEYDSINNGNHVDEEYFFLDEESCRRFIESKTKFDGYPCTVKKMGDSDYWLLVEVDEILDPVEWEVFFNEKTRYEGEK